MQWFGDVTKAVEAESPAPREDGISRIDLDIPSRKIFLCQRPPVAAAEGCQGGTVLFPVVTRWTSSTPDYREPEQLDGSP
jgi:hypothetical protein